MKVLVVALVLAGTPSALSAQVTVFRGRPLVKISEAGLDRVVNKMTLDDAVNLETVISRVGDDYYWASRENVPMVRIEKGAFITFVAVTGAGYVKLVNPDLKAAVGAMSETESNFDYVEHMTIGLRSVTYFGTARN